MRIMLQFFGDKSADETVLGLMQTADWRLNDGGTVRRNRYSRWAMSRGRRSPPTLP
jgi:hypothetical protein